MRLYYTLCQDKTGKAYINQVSDNPETLNMLESEVILYSDDDVLTLDNHITTVYQDIPLETKIWQGVVRREHYLICTKELFSYKDLLWERVQPEMVLVEIATYKNGTLKKVNCDNYKRAWDLYNLTV